MTGVQTCALPIYKIPFLNSEQFLKAKNVDISKISIDDFLSITEINEIESYLNRPLVKRAKWDKWDYITVFTISLIGVIIDTLVGNPKRVFLQYAQIKIHI